MTIDTDSFSSRMRSASIDVANQRVLITNFRGSRQERDLAEPSNCGGVGRIRHFRTSTDEGWPENPLPILPAAKALGIPPSRVLRAQVFQNAACNWRCWYCYVDFDLLSANEKRAEWLDAQALLARHRAQADPPTVIDLTGGQPDLVPEWIYWMLKAVAASSLSGRVYLWSDDNLSNDYFWRYLSERQRDEIAGDSHYGRVCCFKGFSPSSFAFNTGAAPELFERQLTLIRRLLGLGLDLYAYVTLTTPTTERIADDMKRFVDRLQEISERLPLRTVPLLIQEFTPVRPRLNSLTTASLKYQWRAVESWSAELAARFSSAERSVNIADVSLK